MGNKKVYRLKKKNTSNMQSWESSVSLFLSFFFFFIIIFFLLFAFSLFGGCSSRVDDGCSCTSLSRAGLAGNVQGKAVRIRPVYSIGSREFNRLPCCRHFENGARFSLDDDDAHASDPLLPPGQK